MHTQMIEASSSGGGGRGLIEEYLLDDAHLGFLDSVQAPKHYGRPHPLPKTAKLQTVSIIDTLSELARDGELKSRGSHPPSFLATTNGESNRKQKSNFPHRQNSGLLELVEGRRYQSKERSWRSKGLIPQDSHHVTAPGLGRAGAAGGYDSSVFAPKSKSGAKTGIKSANPVSVPGKNRTRGEKESRSCFSDSEIDGLDFNAVGKAKVGPGCGDGHHQGALAKVKCPSNDCLDSVQDNSYLSWTVQKNSMARSGSHLTNGKQLALSKPKSEHFGFRRAPPRKHHVPEWIRTLFVTAKQGNVEMLKLSMVDMDSALVRNLSDPNGNNLWHLSSAHNQLACLQWLCDRFGEEGLEDENKSGQTPVILAIKFGNLSIVQWLLERYPNYSTTDRLDGNRTLLHYAAKYGQISVLTWLINCNGVNSVNALDSSGNSPLHLAAKYGHIECIKEIVLRGGDLCLRNETGLKPYDVALCCNKKVASEYLLSIEACFLLSTEQCQIENDVNRYKLKNSEAKKTIKDLMLLLNDSLNQQRNLLDSFKRIQREFHQKEEEADDHSAESEKGEERRNDNLHLEFHNTLNTELDRWSNTIVPQNETACRNIEERWKRKCRKTTSQIACGKRDPIDIVKFQFNQIQRKASYYAALQKVDSASLSESSLLDDSGDESFPFQKQPNLVSLPSRSRSSWLASTEPNVAHKENSVALVESVTRRVPNGIDYKKKKKQSVFDADWSFQLPHSDIDLRELFERNPELKQEGRTCSVLEVLEPSSSENEELTQIQKISVGTPDRDSLQSGTSSKSRTNSKQSKDSQSLSDCQNSSPGGSRSKTAPALPSRARRKDVLALTLPVVKPVENSTPKRFSMSKSISTAQIHIGEASSKSRDFPNSESRNAKIESKRKVSTVSAAPILEQCRQPQTKNSSFDGSEIELDSLSTNGTQQEQDEATAKSSEAHQLENGMSPPAGGLKKKGFLLKFSLKNRWSSKQKQQRSPKKPEPSEASSHNYELPPLPTPSDIEENEDKDLEESITAATFKKMDRPERLLPPPPPTTRREPPPMPPVENDVEADYEEATEMTVPDGSSSSDSSSNNNLPDILNASNFAPTPPQSHVDRFCSSSDLSRLYGGCSTGKSDSRPPSSASRIESTMRMEDPYKSISFPLSKMSSASTEILVTPDSSTAGRHSPAPSEVSKTESALSPPSDVSKTESQRHMNHLGRIEETHVQKNVLLEVGSGSNSAITPTTITIADQDSPEGNSESNAAQQFRQLGNISKKRSVNKPWYEVSDDEDSLNPGRFKPLSNSEDEGNVLVS